MSSTATEPRQYTRCPSCATTFRVTPAQLAARGGKVRCGHCYSVFDANQNAVVLAPAMGDHNLPRKAATGEDERAVEESLAPGASPEEPIAKNETPAVDAIASVDQAAAEEHIASAPIGEAAILPAAPRRARWGILFALGIPVLTLLLLAQAMFQFRDAIASRWPNSGPALTRICEIAGCALQPLHEIGYLSIEASDLQVDPAHKGLLILTATVRNRAPYALAYPYLELTLTDSHDQVVVRRALPPKDYAGGTSDLDAGIAANAELAVKLFIDASASTQVGYRVYLFYP